MEEEIASTLEIEGIDTSRDSVRRILQGYYKAYTLTEDNSKLSGVMDITPFLTYFIHEVYDRLDQALPKPDSMLLFQNALTEGNRLVGIISHVSELKEKIDRQIVVRKDCANGSYAEIVM